MWIGSVQWMHHTLARPTGSVQEAAWCKAFTGGPHGIQPWYWKVRGEYCVLGVNHRFLSLGFVHTETITQLLSSFF